MFGSSEPGTPPPPPPSEPYNPNGRAAPTLNMNNLNAEHVLQESHGMLSFLRRKRQNELDELDQLATGSNVGGADLAYEIEVVRDASGRDPPGAGYNGASTPSTAASSEGGLPLSSRSRSFKSALGSKSSTKSKASHTIITTPVIMKADSDDAVLSDVGGEYDGYDGEGVDRFDDNPNKRGATYETVKMGKKRSYDDKRRKWIICAVFTLLLLGILGAFLFVLYQQGILTGGSGSSKSAATEVLTVDDNFGGPLTVDDNFGGPVIPGTPTATPITPSPTDEPTVQTEAPTLSPTQEPTASPTQYPTETFVPNPPRDTGNNCQSADDTPLANNRHIYPQENSPVSRIAFGSCFKPENQVSSVLWQDVRNFEPELFIWLGDNAYEAGTDMSDKRQAYNDARMDPYYATYGPVAYPQIPVTGTWDDNDFGEGEGQGNDYGCLASSQAEFVYHMAVPQDDPRHPSQGPWQRAGVYSSHMFSKPATAAATADGGAGEGDGGGDATTGADNADNTATRTENGIHVINLDVRSHRSPTRTTRDPDCEGPMSTILGEEQWKWLERELMQRKSVIKVISSGTQVLPPTTRERDIEEHCAYDFPGGFFDQANSAVGEGPLHAGNPYEGWAEIPQDRTRLLRLAQRSINAGMAKRIIFLSGEQHWAELMAKKMSADVEGGSVEQILYEATASGIDQNWIEDIGNSNRVRVRSADTRGNGFYDQECNFPFVIDGVEYDDCADVFGTGEPGCSFATTSAGLAINGRWGNCLPEAEELVPRDRQRYSLENKCADNYHMTCSAQANYGAMTVDWDEGTITLSLRTPHHDFPVASEIVIDI